MSFLIAPEFVSSAVSDLSGVGAQLEDAVSAAASRTSVVAAAAGDEVSVAVAALFASHGEAFQAVSGQVADPAAVRGAAVG